MTGLSTDANATKPMIPFPEPPLSDDSPSSVPPDQAPPAALIGRRIVVLEGQIARHYQALRRRQQPSYRFKESEPAFLKAAELVHAHGADPFEWIDAQFALNAFGSYPPPSHIGCEAALERWREFRRQRDDVSPAPPRPGEQNQTVYSARAEGLWRCHQLYLSLLRKRCGRSESEIFLGLGLPLRAWFRLLCCPDPLLPEVERRYGEAARRQLRADESLLRYLEHLSEPAPSTNSANLIPTATVNATLRPVRQILSGGAPGPSAPDPRIIPFPH